MNNHSARRRVADTGFVVVCGCLLVTALIAVQAQEAGTAPAKKTVLVQLDDTGLVPQDMRVGTDYKVSDHVLNDGLFNTYQVQTTDGPLNVESTALLYKRIGELKALEQIGDIKKTKTFGDAMKTAGKAPFKTAQNLIESPVQTVKNVGSGIGHWITDVGSSVIHRGEDQPGTLKTALGQAATARQYAYKLNVDPYSSYEPLKKALNGVAWTSTAGGITIKAAFSAVQGDAGKALSIGGAAGGMKALVRDKSPAELNDIIKTHLNEIGVPEAVRNSFLANTHYSLQERLILVNQVATMEGIENRQVFFQAAATVPSEAAALYMRTQADMMARYAKDNPVTRFIAAGGTTFMQTKAGTVVGVLPLDSLRWTAAVSGKIDQIQADLDAAQLTDAAKRLLVMGTIQADAKTALTGHGWTLKDNLTAVLRDI